MASIQNNEVIGRIQAHAYNRLAATRRPSTNLYLDHRVHEKGQQLGPAFQKLTADRPTVIVFADDDPMANFGHSCRYLCYDPKTGDHLRDLLARFPSDTEPKALNLKAFHEPVKLGTASNLFHVWPIYRCPLILPDGNRYAIFYSGMSNMRHLNDMEFGYRTLVDRYGFDPKNIYVCNYDCSLNTQDGPGVTWPGDGTPYRIKVTHGGWRADFQAALSLVASKIKGDDLLFIHTNNHGDNSGTQSFLCEYPNFSLTYMASDFCSDLKTLPAFRDLIVMMEQCNSGGFNSPVLAASPAKNTSIASAAIASQSSYASPDGHWDSFARDWFSGQMGHDPYGAALASNPDTNGDGVIEATEAYNYAVSVQNPSDSPNFSDNSAAGGKVSLNQKYSFYWIWCWILWPLLEKYYVAGPVPYPGPGPEFQQTLQTILPELQKLMMPVIDREATDLRRELAPKAEEIIKRAFEKK